MPNLNNRLAKLLSEQAERQAAKSGPIVTALVDFVSTQPAPLKAAFWRVSHARYAPGDIAPEALALCGGTFDVTADDQAVYARLVSKFFNGDNDPNPDSSPDPAPTPARELEPA